MNTHDTDMNELLGQRGWLKSLAWDLVGNEADADDVVQDAMLKALQRGDSARAARPWLRTVLRNAALDRMRRRDRRSTVEGAAASEPGDAERTADERSRLYRILWEELEALPDASRRALTMRYFDDLDSREIGRRLHISPSAVRQRMARATGELRARLNARGEKGMRRFALALIAASGDFGHHGVSSTAAALASMKAVKLLAGVLLVGTVGFMSATPWRAEEDPPLDHFVETAEIEGVRRGALPPQRDDGAAENAVFTSPPTPTLADHVTPVARPEATIRGVVFDGSGHPVQHAAVRAVIRSRPGVHDIVTTGEDGAYTIRLGDHGAPERGDIVVHAERYGLGTATGDAPADDGSLDLVLRGAGIFEGILVDRSGAPEPHFSLAVLPEDRSAELEPTLDRDHFSVEGPAGSLSQRVETDADGRFRVSGMRPGRYIFVSDEPFCRVVGPRTIFGTGETSVRLVTDRHSIVVRVVDKDGAPVEGVNVSILARPPDHPELDPGFDFRSSTDAEGLVIAAVEPGSVAALAVHDGDVRLHEEVVTLGPRESRRVITVTRPASVDCGILTIETDRPVASDVRVDLLSPVNDLIISHRFEIPARWDGLAAGRYRVRVRPNGADAMLDFHDVDVEVASGRTTTERVELPVTARFELRSPDGIRAAGLRATLARAGVGPWIGVRTAVTASGVVVSTEQIAPGRYEIAVEGEDGFHVRRTIVLTAGGSTVVDLGAR